MAAILLVVGAIWFIRLAVEEFLLIDRVVNVYTNDAAVQMDSFGVRPQITAQVLEVLVGEGDIVEKGQLLFRLAQDDIQVELQEANAVAEAIAQQLQEMRQEMPLTIERAESEVVRAQALVETKHQAHRRAQVFLSVQRDRISQMQREHRASIDTAQARLREQETASRESQMTLERTHQLFNDGNRVSGSSRCGPDCLGAAASAAGGDRGAGAPSRGAFSLRGFASDDSRA